MPAEGDLDFASEAWVRVADEELKQLAAASGGALMGQRLTISQVLTGVPSHLTPADPGELAWSLVVEGGAAMAQPIALERPNLKVRADYETMRRSAGTIHDGSPERMAERQRLRDEAITDGRIIETGSLEGQSAAMLRLLGALHNRMAVRTR